MELVNFVLTYMIKAATIFVFLFLLSCTVTKRVHRPGFHIEWKKNYRVQNDKSERKTEEAKNDPITVSIDELPARDVRSTDLPKETVVSSIPEIKEGEMATDSSPLEEFSEKPKVVEERSRKHFPLQLNKTEKSKEDTLSRFDGQGFYNFGIVMLWVAVFFLLGTFLAYYGLWALESIFYSLVFSGGGFIAGVLGFILFLLIFLIAFIAFAVVELLLGGHVAGLIATGICAAIGGICLLISMA